MLHQSHSHTHLNELISSNLKYHCKSNARKKKIIHGTTSLKTPVVKCAFMYLISMLYNSTSLLYKGFANSLQISKS